MLTDQRLDQLCNDLQLCFLRFRPTKAYFMYTLKWSVLQYVVIRPAISIAGIICQALNVLCESGSYSVHFAAVYLDAIDFVSISVALYGLIVFYALTREELQGKRPLAKFLAIKAIVFFTFYQSFVFNTLQGHGVIKGTTYWTATNIADGLNALATCIEMVFFAAFMMWAYSWNEYATNDGSHTSIWRALWDRINYTDFAMEIFGSLKFFIDYARGKPNTRGQLRIADHEHGKVPATFGEAFGIEGYVSSKASPVGRDSFDESIGLRAYRR